MALTAAEKQSAYRARKKDEDAYVKKSMTLDPIVGAHGLAEARRLQEEYARWRFKGFHNGSIASL